MPKYQFSIVRFVPSPIRGEFVNLGLIVGSDHTGEWQIEVVSSRSRATKLDDENVFPMVASDLQRIQTMIESYSEPELFDPKVELSEDWLRQLSRDSQGVLQYSSPRAVLADTAASALQKLWSNLIVEHVPTGRSTISKATVISKFLAALTDRNLTSKNLKRRARLETSKTHTPIDVVVHNGVVKDITQCWSFQIKDAENLLSDIKAWGWTIRNLRELGGKIITENSEITVPSDVSVGVIYAPGADNALFDEAMDVFGDGDVGAETVLLDAVETHAEAAVQRLRAS